MNEIFKPQELFTHAMLLSDCLLFPIVVWELVDISQFNISQQSDCIG